MKHTFKTNIKNINHVSAVSRHYGLATTPHGGDDAPFAPKASFTPTKLGLQRAARCFVDAFRCKREISMLAWWRHEQGCHVTSSEVTTLQIAAGIVRPLNWIIFSEARCLFVTFYLLWCVVVCTRLLTWSQFLNEVLINFIKLGSTACIRMKKIWS